MEIIYFLLFIVVCFGVLMWVSRKSSSDKDLARSASGMRKPGAGNLQTPADNVLAHRKAIWQSRRNSTAASVDKTNKFVPKSASSQEPEYDGYSRRDRHHVTADPVHVKDEAHADDLGISSRVQSV